MQIIKANLAYTKPLIPLVLEKVEYIALHHAEAFTASAENIHKWHLKNGWSGAGYNEYIRKNGDVIIMRGDNIGAQCDKMNSTTYGICVEGDYEKGTKMPDAQFNSLVQRIMYNKPRFPNLKSVEPHSALNATKCPGKNFPMDRILFDVKELELKSLEIKDPKMYNTGFVKSVIVRFVADYKIVKDTNEAIDKLKEMGVIDSPDFWKQGMSKDKIKAEYVAKLLLNISNYIYKPKQ